MKNEKDNKEKTIFRYSISGGVWCGTLKDYNTKKGVKLNFPLTSPPQITSDEKRDRRDWKDKG